MKDLFELSIILIGLLLITVLGFIGLFAAFAVPIASIVAVMYAVKVFFL